jgi:glutamate racemase
VVLACNTASAIALRRLQQTWLPGYRKALGRPINVLGIIVPTIEAATGLPWEHEAERRGDKVEQLDVLGVFSTQGTTNSRVYEIEIDKRKQDIAVFSQACPDLVPMIEADAGAVDLAKAVEGYVQALKTRIGRYPDRAVLGCTHYEIIADIFRAALPAGTPVIHQPASTADALELYLQRHPELDPGTGGARKFLTTGAPGRRTGLWRASGAGRCGSRRLRPSPPWGGDRAAIGTWIPILGPRPFPPLPPPSASPTLPPRGEDA